MIDEDDVCELFRAAAGWSRLEKLFGFWGWDRASRFCRRRARNVDARAVAALHVLMHDVERMVD